MKLEDLERELRAERPDVDPEFARKLDEWAAAGFPRGGELAPRAPRSRAGRGFPATLRRAWERVTAVPPRRILAPAGAATVLIVMVGVGVSQVDFGGDVSPTSGGASETALQESGGGNEAIAPAAGAPDADAPNAVVPGADLPEAVQSEAPSPNQRLEDAGEYNLSAPETSAVIDPVSPNSDGGVARGTDERIEDRTARLSLGADADEVPAVANGVIEVTDRHDGIVLNSQVTSDQGGARASFQLEIPVTELDAAIADLSELGDVISRTEASEDITQGYVRAQKERARVLDRIQELRIDRIQADTHEERLVIKSQINALEAQAETFEAQANSVERRARFATLAVNVTSNGPDTDDGWSLGDAVDDAGDVLRTLAGVGLVSLAILVPVAVVGGIAFWIGSSARRRGRERALDS